MSELKSTPRRRRIFVLTPEERRTIAFVLCAFVLGVATKHYRDKHPPPRPSTIREERAARKTANASHPSRSPLRPPIEGE